MKTVIVFAIELPGVERDQKCVISFIQIIRKIYTLGSHYPKNTQKLYLFYFERITQISYIKLYDGTKQRMVLPNMGVYGIIFDECIDNEYPF